MTPRSLSSVLAISLFFHPTSASAGDAATSCEASKLKTAAKYGACRLSAESKAVKRGESADYTRCLEKFSDKWQSAESRAGSGVCPSEADESQIERLVTDHTARTAALLAGVRFQDCGDGTVADVETGLMWQRSDTNVFEVTYFGNTYTWSDGSSQPDGTLFLTFLAGLNDCKTTDGLTRTVGFAGHCDWRIPQVDELLGVLDCNLGTPCIDDELFGPNTTGFFWSATTDGTDPTKAWWVDFFSGATFAVEKSVPGPQVPVRAVRNGACP